MKVINFFGAPCKGKTGFAAYALAKLKSRGHNVSIALEAASDFIHEQSFYKLKNQVLVLGEQLNRIERARVSGYDIVVTDCPLLIGAIYNTEGKELFEKLCYLHFNKYDNINFLLDCNFQFRQTGRIHSQEESDAIHTKVQNLLCQYRISFHSVTSFLEADKILLEKYAL